MVAASEPTARKLRAIERGQWPIQFSHVIQPAQAFLVATIARKIDETIWVLCPSVHSQELLYESLLNWYPTALFLPEAEFAAVENVLPDPEIAAERLALLTQIERKSGPHLIVATHQSLNHAAPRRGALQSAIVQLQRGANEKMERVLERLVGAGYDRVAQVTTRGQFAVRGGIVDLYSWQAPLPVRLEFLGDEIESLREFDIDTQVSVRDFDSVDIFLGATEDQSGIIRDYAARDHLKVDIEPENSSSANIQISECWIEIGPEDFRGAFQDCEVGKFAVGDLVLAEAKRAQFAAFLKEWRANQAKVVIYFQTEGEIERFCEILGGVTEGVDLVEGTLARGFCFPAANLVVLAAAELFGRFAAHPRQRLRRAERHRVQIDFSELTEGDFVVHLEHGIARFLGLQKFGSARPEPLPSEVEGGAPGNAITDGPAVRPYQQEAQEVLVLEFADEAKLYVPLEQAYLVSRYVGVGKKSPSLSSLGDAKWMRAKRNAAASIFDYAGKMLAVQAERQTHPGHAFAPDTRWQAEFDHSFPFRETPDQMKAIIDTKIDMERSQPMDRLICGDVGFGKTEVAIRAAFKAVMNGKQVAVLAPTTVLAQQHFEVFRPRMLDVSLVGVKDMSTIETPPLNRLPVETVVSAYDERIIRDAINRELERQGQVFFLHNRVMTIERARDRIVDLCPQARVEIGHGQMDSDELEAIMAQFVAGKIDVLVCTTIIESGLDIPNANTIIIDRADRFGLADLYQLRGRVGRAEHKAYAYLLLPRELLPIGAARKRISAIKQYSSLGAGFRIAMRDLEIRGAGSILGTAQSGHIMTVGFDLYCQLLKQAVAQLKGEKLRLRVDVDLQLDFVATNESQFAHLGPETCVPAFVPSSFIDDATLRIRAYRDIAEITTHEQLDRLW